MGSRVLATDWGIEARSSFGISDSRKLWWLTSLALARKAKGITLLQLLSLNDCGPELGKKRCFAIAQFYGRQRARYRHVIKTIFHGRLAGGTIPFMRRYSTICP